MKKIIFLLILALALSGAASYYRAEARRQEENAARYRLNSEMLADKLRRLYDEKQKLEQQNKILETEAKKDSAFFNWNADISTSAVIKRLRRE